MTNVIGIDADEAVIADIIDALPDQAWCERDFASLNFSGALRSGWQEFVDQVKHHTRYMFTEPPARPIAAPTASEDGEEPFQFPRLPDEAFGIDWDKDDGVSPSLILDAVGKIVSKSNMLKSVNVGTILFRARVDGTDANPSTAAELGPPPREKATRSNRMTPAGIPMFYGAFDRNTAILETVAQFTAKHPLTVLDFTQLPAIPSFWEPWNRDLRHGLSFLHSFVNDLTQPVARDGMEPIDYVPTQIVTDFFRYRFQTDEGKSIDGIVYQSSRPGGERASVLFLTHERCGVRTGFFDRDSTIELLPDRTERIAGWDLAQQP